jgi:hypothetical protein
MPLSNKDLSDIAKEYSSAKSDQADDKAAIPNIQKEITKKEDQTLRVYIPYNNAHIERVTPYETEHRWLDGTTYTTITNQQIVDAGNRTTSNIFFPSSWAKSNAILTTSGNGNPKTSSANSENSILSGSLENQGLIVQIDLLRNGQSSAAVTDQLDDIYTPGSSSIKVVHTDHTIGKLLYIYGSGTSAVVRITGIVGYDLTITEIIPPASSIALGGSVVENISGFTNTERNTLVSSQYQRILTQLTNRIISSAALWNTALGNQLGQLNLNIDAQTQITNAKTNINTAVVAYNTWLALLNTGISGKFVNSSLNDLTTACNARVSQITPRVNEIIAALGSVSQDAQGNYSGTGNYLQRFKTLNFLINGSNGPLFQINGLKAAKTNLEQKVVNGSDKLATYSNLVRLAVFTADPIGTTVKVDTVVGFTVGNGVLIVGNDLPAINCNILSISGTTVGLNITIPKEYTKAIKSGLIKPV